MVGFDDASLYTGWQTLSMAAAAISVLAAIFLIQISRILGLRNLEQVAKSELVFAVSTVLIVVMALTMIQLGERLLASDPQSLAKCFYLGSFNCNCDAQVTFPEQRTLIDWTKLYMKTPQDCVQKFMTTLYWASIPLEFCTSIYAEVFMSEVASGFGCKPFAERISNTASQLTFFTYIYYLLDYILDFIKYYGGFFFSIGVVLRAFPPTRGVGAYVMALSFGLYFIFPLSYILIASISAPHTQSQLVVPENRAAVTGGGLSCATPASGTAGGTNFRYICLLPEIADPHDSSCQSISMGEAFSVGDRIRAISDALVSLFSFQIGDFLRHISNAICVFPLIAAVIFMTFVLNTTGLFGGNIPEIGRGLVKLI